MRVDFCRTRAKSVEDARFGRIQLPKLGRARPNLANHGYIRPTWGNSKQIWPEFRRCWPNLARKRPGFPLLQSNLVQHKLVATRAGEMLARLVVGSVVACRSRSHKTALAQPGFCVDTFVASRVVWRGAAVSRMERPELLLRFATIMVDLLKNDNLKGDQKILTRCPPRAHAHIRGRGVAPGLCVHHPCFPTDVARYQELDVGCNLPGAEKASGCPRSLHRAHDADSAATRPPHAQHSPPLWAEREADKQGTAADSRSGRNSSSFIVGAASGRQHHATRPTHAGPSVCHFRGFADMALCFAHLEQVLAIHFWQHQ